MLLQTKLLGKRFGETVALAGVSMDVQAGEIHALVGENGAGKSTLIKILTGVYPKDTGQVVWRGEPVEIRSPGHSRELGINVIHQDRHLVPSFKGVENAYLGLEYPRKGPRVDWGAMERRVRLLMEELELQIPLERTAAEMTPPQRTQLEILRAMMVDCRLLILDEPTASLTAQEAERLFGLLRGLRERGTGILYVSHRMDEILALSHRVTVLKNGAHAATLDTSTTTRETLISLMTDQYTAGQEWGTRSAEGPVLLEAEGIASADGIVRDVSLTARGGAILGVFGLGGAGKTETLECIYGSRRLSAGSVALEGAPYPKPSPRASIERGMVIICEDRRGKALVMSRSVQENTVLSVLDRYSRGGVADDRGQLRDTQAQIEALRIRTQGPRQPVEQLSGGNQQKVVFAKALMSDPRVILCDEPTQAVDVATRAEIHRLLRRLADGGAAVVFVSSDLLEVLELADSLLVIAEGRSAALLENRDLQPETVLGHCYAGRQSEGGAFHEG